MFCFLNKCLAHYTFKKLYIFTVAILELKKFLNDIYVVYD